jgi:flagellar motor switch protein FliM
VSSDMLSQYDIDRLLGGAGSAAVAAPSSLPGFTKQTATPEDAEVAVYDFRRPHRVSKERLRTLEAMYERMVKSLEGWIIGRVRGQIEMRLQSVEQFSFGEFTLSLPTPCATYIFDVKNTGGAQGVIDIGHEFAYFTVDRFFGGSGSATIPNRSLSPVERMTVRLVAERAVQLVEEIWQDHVPLELQITGFESSPEILQIANREDPVLVANVEVIAGQTSSLLLICLPFAVLEKFFQASGNKRIGAAAGTEQEREEARQRTEAALRATPVTIAARLPRFQMSLRDLSQLAPGQVLTTGIPRDAELSVLVGGRPRFRGSAGRVGRKLAVRLLDSIAPPDNVEADEDASG